MSDLRYPIGPFAYAPPTTSDQRAARIADLAALPAAMRAAVAGLSAGQLDTPYRPDGWTVRQLVHHVPDSHLNAYVRFKLALTEDVPTIKPYEEQLWAELPDARSGPIEPSLGLLDHLHDRWVRVLKAMAPADFSRRFNHPVSGLMDLDRVLAMYAWHGKHHVAHITSLRQRQAW